MLKQTHTYVILELSPPAFTEINRKLSDAGYNRSFHNEDEKLVIDMQGIAVSPEVYVPHRHDNENLPVIRKYILARRGSEYLIHLSEEMSVRYQTQDQPINIPPRVVAVYKPTGRGPFRDGDDVGYEFEYQGVRFIVQG